MRSHQRGISGHSFRLTPTAAFIVSALAGANVGLSQPSSSGQAPSAGLNNMPKTPPAPNTPAAPKAESTTPMPISPVGPPKPNVQEPPTNPDALTGAGQQAMTQPGGMDPGSKPESKGQMDIRVDSNQLVDLAVKDEELANVLEMLSIQSQRNIIASKEVSARVTANFFGVTFHQALEAILHANGFGFVEKDNFIFVYTGEQMKTIAEAERVRACRVIKLNYLNAIDAAEFVKAALSDGGQIKTPGKTTPFPGKSDVPTGQDDYASGATMVVTDYEENIKAVEELVKQLDTRPAQVLVEATILQASLNEANAFGIDFALIGNLNFADFTPIGGPLKTVDSLGVNDRTKLSGPGAADLPAVGADGGGAVVSNAGNALGGPATLKMGIIKNDVAFFLRVLDEVTDTTILSNPKIMALNRMPARVLVGQRVGYLSSTSTDTATTQTVEFLDTGTQLHFRPFVSDDGMIRLELKPQVSTAVVRDIKNSSGATVTVPDEITNELTTNVIVGNGQTVVLGGLFRDKTQSTRRQVPFLGDIPFLGEAFRGHDDTIERTEIIFLITPTIVNDQAMASMGKRGNEAIDRVRSGTRENLLGFSRDKRSSQMLVEAQRLADSGDTQKALWKIEQSLTLSPMQPDAIALKEKLSGQKKTAPNRSMLDDIMRKEQGLPEAPKAQVVPGTIETSGSSASLSTDQIIQNYTAQAAAKQLVAVEPTKTTPSVEQTAAPVAQTAAPVSEPVAPVVEPVVTEQNETVQPAPQAGEGEPQAMASEPKHWSVVVNEGEAKLNTTPAMTDESSENAVTVETTTTTPPTPTTPMSEFDDEQTREFIRQMFAALFGIYGGWPESGSQNTPVTQVPEEPAQTDLSPVASPTNTNK